MAIGSFDGVHLGHRALIEKARAIAKQTSAPMGVMTFEPHPRRFFQPDATPFLLTTLPTKQHLFEETGVDFLFALEFDQAFSQIDGTDFIKKVLVENIGASHIVVGPDFAFGHKRSGTVASLEAVASAGKFKLSVMPSVTGPDGCVYSSTAIRAQLKQAKFFEAEKNLGRPWQMEAPVIHGDKRGRTLNYPTANQDFREYVRIPYGVYAVKVLIDGERNWRNGAANFGIRPMFKSEQPIFETFIFDFSEEIYGKNMAVRPVKYLRPELSFVDVQALMAQMKEDCITAKAVLESPPV